MIEAGRGHWASAPAPLLNAGQRSESSRSPLLRSAVLAGLLVMLILSPVQFVVLPLNLAPVDLWNALFLPISWLYLIRIRQPVRLPFIAAMWLILLGSFIGTFSAPHPIGSLTAILKDVYLYVWFVTVTALLASLGAGDFRRIMLVWSGVVLLHGILIAAQFLSPEIFRATATLAAKFGALDRWRPSGLFENANAAALFQLMGFAPLLITRIPQRIATLLGIFLLFSIVATGSLAAMAGFLVGLVIVGITIPIVTGRLGPTLRLSAKVATATLILGGLLYLALSWNLDLSARFDYIAIGRVEGSAEGRFSLWERGLALLSSQTLLWGIGPDAYKDVDQFHRPLHNDLLAFIVERGLIGTLGLILLTAIALAKAMRLLLAQKRAPDEAGLAIVVFLAAILAATVHGQFHQVFHHRSVWLVLAAQEALLLRQVGFRRESMQPMDTPQSTTSSPTALVQRHVPRD